MSFRTTLFGLGLALVATSAFAFPPPPPLPPPPPSPSVVAHDIGSVLHHETHPREWHHGRHVACARHHRYGHCTQWKHHHG